MGDYNIFISTLSDLTSRLSGSNAYRYWTQKKGIGSSSGFSVFSIIPSFHNPLLFNYNRFDSWNVIISNNSFTYKYHSCANTDL